MYATARIAFHRESLALSSDGWREPPSPASLIFAHGKPPAQVVRAFVPSGAPFRTKLRTCIPLKLLC